MEAHLRREERKSGSRNVYMDKDIVVDFTGHMVLAEGEDIGLTKTEFSIVELVADPCRAGV